MFFPLAIFAHLATAEVITEFNTMGRGWFLYKKTSESGVTYTMNSFMKKEKAAQVVFYSIFGTYKEDLDILEQITNTGTWYTREKLGNCFSKPSVAYTPVTPTLTFSNI